MNPKALAAWAAKNRPAVIGVGAAGAVGLGLLARKRAGGDANAAPTPQHSSYSAGGQVDTVTGGGGAYDSSATDLYSALSPELAGIAQQLEKLNGTGKSPTPVPAPPKPAAAKLAAGFYRDAKTKSLYQILPDGRRDHLTMPEYTALGKPKAKAVAHDQITTIPLIGTAGKYGKGK